MTNRPRAIGTKTETAVVRHLAANGFPHAERAPLHGSVDHGDITGTPGICWSVKGGKAAEEASDAQILAWLSEAGVQRHNRGSDHSILILKRKGKGPANAGAWWAILEGHSFVHLATAGESWDYDWTPVVRVTLADAVLLFRHAGYGSRLTGQVA